METTIIEHGEPPTMMLRRGHPGLPVELVVFDEATGLTHIWTIPHQRLLCMVADAAGYLASRVGK